MRIDDGGTGFSDEALRRTLERNRQLSTASGPGNNPDLEPWQRADRVFVQALELPETERPAFLEEACSEDSQLRQLVHELLGFDEALGSFSEGPALEAVERAAAEASAEQHIGPYRLLGQLGSGGMGTVYLAEQSEPVERKVALKLIKAGMDSEQVLARFEGERQALALMDHANVARVYDAGAAGTGRSYFAMEYVPGHEITEHCDRAELGFRDRVRLFLQVCDGVQHAHQKGLIHRDLKPSNILVKSAQGEPATVKIIDFGVAKSMQRKLSAHAAHTQLGTFVGTPVYSSPEQILGRFGETDTRSDIYSLGVVLYELLVGTPPHTWDDFDGRSQEEIARMLSEEPPTKPIHRFTTTTGKDAETVAQRRSLTVEQMQRRLRGDVSWILLKCLERRPEERYPSVSELRKDLERWLEGLPLEARPATGLYRLRTFVRRHRTGVAVTALVGAALLTTTAAAVTGFLRAERAAEEAELAADFQVEQLQELDPAAMGLGLRTKLIDEIRHRLGEQEVEPSVLEADLKTLEGLLSHANFTDLSLSLLDDQLFARAETAIAEKYGETPLLQARLWQSVADTRRELGQFEAAVEPQQRALAVRRRELGDEHPLTLESLASRGFLWLVMGRLDAAEGDLRQAAEARRRVLGDEHPETVISIGTLGSSLQAQGKLAEAEPNLREALETHRRVLGNEHPDTLISIGNLGSLLSDQGKLAEAEPYYREALEASRQVLGDEHPGTLISVNNLGFLLSSQGRAAEAEPYYREALETSRRVLGNEHRDTLISINNLGSLLRSQGKFGEAEALFREALATRRRVLGDAHPDTLFTVNSVGLLFRSQGQLAEAEPYFREALETRRRVLGEEHPDTLVSMGNLGLLLMSQGKLSEAETYGRKALDAYRRLYGEERLDSLRAARNLAKILNERSKYAEVTELLEETLPTADGALGKEHQVSAEMRSLLGEALVGLGAYDGAEPLLLDGYQALEASLSADDERVRQAAERLAALYEAWGRAAQAKEWWEKSGKEKGG